MKVLLYSHFFYPDLGGLETVSLTLAEGFIANKIDCKVITTSHGGEGQSFPFDVIRNPDRKEKIDLVKWADVILFNGASLALQPWILWYRKPFLWIHVGYQVSCIDGLGWVDGKPAPITPFKSFLFHTKLKGLKWGITEGIKLIIRRFFCKYLVTKNVAITEWMYKMQPLPRQIHIYNPFPVDRFQAQKNNTNPDYDFIYLGRLVSEKGVVTLLNAFSKVTTSGYGKARLLIIGDGSWREKMEELTHVLSINNFVTFAGKQSGEELLNWVARGEIAVVPSEWYEPMGGVALEFMAAGKSLIVSASGGLKECVGDAGLIFPNGDADALAACMVKLLNDDALRERQRVFGQERIMIFHPSIFILHYISLLNTCIID